MEKNKKNDVAIVSGLENQNKYIDNSIEQNPYWMQSNTTQQQSQSNNVSSNVLGEQDESTFEISLNNPYISQVVTNDNDVENSDPTTNELLLDKIADVSSSVQNYTEISSDISGIAKDIKYDVQLNIPDILVQNQNPIVEAIPQPQTQLPQSTFIGSTLSLPTIDTTQQVLPSSNLVELSNEKKFYQTLSKRRNITIWLMISFFSIIIISLFLIWVFSYWNVFDWQLDWPGFYPTN